jgi:hypothetical protein
MKNNFQKSMGWVGRTTKKGERGKIDFRICVPQKKEW